MEKDGAHPLHHSVIGGSLFSSFSLFHLSTSAVKQQHLEEVCKGDLDGEKAARVLQWGADLVKYYRSLEPGIFPPR